jgi:DNA (cytosine-5)-methyltransferase 1
MNINKLQKYDFLMEEVRIADFFCGIGALHQSLKDLGVPCKVEFISEIDIDATISYAASHIPNFKDIEIEYPSDDKMKQWLMDRNIGYNYEKDKSSVPRMNKNKLRMAYKANLLLNNLGDIAKINYEEAPDFDLMNFSFSCTDLSVSGKQMGMKNPDGTPTRSGLYVHGLEAIRTKKPKYIMIENVKGLIQKKFIDDFYSIIDELNETGYNCYYPTKHNDKGDIIPTCLNAKHFGVPQNRERIFVICIRKDIDNGSFGFPVGKVYNNKIKDILEESVDEKYYINREWTFVEDKGHQGEFIHGSFEQNKRLYSEENSTMRTLSAADRGHNNIIVKARINGINFKQIGNILDAEGICSTLDTMQGGYREPKVLEEYRVRKLTPKECWRLMGFPDENFDRAKEMNISDSQLYKQAGNSIAINCLYYIFKNLFEDYMI